jgi:hypothetical protein
MHSPAASFIVTDARFDTTSLTERELLKLLKNAGTLLRETGEVSLILFRIMIPVMIVVKILQELDLIKYIAGAFSPVMELVGLPGCLGLVWATAMLTNTYGGIAVFVAMAPTLHLSVAQITVIASMILIAHSLAVEITVARKAGVRLRFSIPFRIICAFVLGFLLNQIFTLGGFLQNEGRILWEAAASNSSLSSWAVSQLRNLATIFIIVLFLLFLLKLLDRLGITKLMNRLLRPLLTSMGIGESAASITIIGLVLGISYGGGLVIKGARSGDIPPRDVFFAVSMMCLAHAMIEDSLLMMSLGASIIGVFFARLLFTWLAISLLVRLVNRLPDSTFFRWFYHTVT